MTDGDKQRVSFTVNGEAREAWVFPHESLLDVLRDAGCHEVRYGCGEGVCGTCTVLLDGEPVSACLLFAVQAEGCSLLTVRGLAQGAAQPGEPHPLQASFLRNGAAQCGFCTPGMLLTAWALLRREPHPTRERIRRELCGNLCRCTGYSKILDAIEDCRQP
ncbi:MAG TPA: (2Fe-2S)-binding protein [Actinomycetota bacterium]